MQQNTRQYAAIALQQVLQGYSLTDVLDDITTFNPQEKATIQHLSYNVCRFFPRLEAIAKALLKKPFKKKDDDIYAALLIGLYQLTETEVPAYAVISEIVDIANRFKKPWAKAVLNATLRTFERNKEIILKKISALNQVRYAHPIWLIDLIKHAWPIHFETIFEENNAHPPMTLRVNLKKITRDNYLAKLSKQKITAYVFEKCATAFILEKPMRVSALPGFTEGECSVQDAAAQFAAPWIMLAPHQRVLDACAAPGGKAMHMLEDEPQLKTLLALERDPKRLLLIQQNMARLALTADCVCADATQPETWWDGQLFDRILIDAPCSGTGVIRRHPDIKLLRRASDIAPLVLEQAKLLESLWPLLKPGGILLYSTCSILPDENNLQLEKFMAVHPEAEEYPLDKTIGLSLSIGQQILPGWQGMDGFYYGRLRKAI